MPDLTLKTLSRVALVDRGDNPGATVALWKRRGDQDVDPPVDKAMQTCPNCGAKVVPGGKTCPQCGTTMPVAKAGRKISGARLSSLRAARDALQGVIDEAEPTTKSADDGPNGPGKEGVMPEEDKPFDKSALPDEAKAYVEGLEKKIEDLEKEPVEKVEPKPEDDVLKGLTPEAAAIVKKAQDDATAANERVEKLETEAAETAIVKRFEGYGSLAMDRGTFAKAFHKFEASDKDAAAKVEETLKAANEQLRLAGILKAKGGNGNGETGGSAEEKLRVAATELKKADEKLDDVTAFAKAAEQNPELHDQMLEEQGIASGRNR